MARGLHASPEKVKAVLNAPQPRNVQELRSFLGMMNYYRKFIPNLATLLKPLTYHPASNGEAERFVRTFKEAMKASGRDGLH